MSSASTPLPDALAKIVERFKRRTDPKQRYAQLLSYAKKLKQMPEEDKVSANKVPGCTSQVFLTANLEDGKVLYPRAFFFIV
ncbi:MAG: hypothetical protein F6K09_38660 [Merismopedia sp. SIO2A8]|nr:hypothetical protein [Merismopedia sp. SIO2A8]